MQHTYTSSHNPSCYSNMSKSSTVVLPNISTRLAAVLAAAEVGMGELGMGARTMSATASSTSVLVTICA